MNYLEFDFETEHAAQMEQLIALLDQLGFVGFEEDDNQLKSYIPENKFVETDFARVLNLFADIIYTRTVVENINWNQKWEEDFKPVLVGDFVAVRAGFHAPIEELEHEIIITPKMSFGTGHHATTYMMIQQMKQLNFSGNCVIDFGTGTGVLAILAEKLGAERVLAIDYDEWSITNTRENIVQNHCDRIEVNLQDELPLAIKVDIVLANINLNVLLAAIPQIFEVTKSGGHILLSGFLKNDEDKMLGALKTAGLKYLSTVQKGDWIAILANKPLIG